MNSDTAYYGGGKKLTKTQGRNKKSPQHTYDNNSNSQNSEAESRENRNVNPYSVLVDQ